MKVYKTENEALRDLAKMKGPFWTIRRDAHGFWRIVQAKQQDAFTGELFDKTSS